MSGSSSSSLHDGWSEAQPHFEGLPSEPDVASTSEYTDASRFPFGWTSPHPHRSSDPHPFPEANFGNRPRSNASSEPRPNFDENRQKKTFKDKGWYYDRTNREHETCQRRFQKLQRTLDECRSGKKEVEEKAQSRGIRLFHCLKEAKKYEEAEQLYHETMDDSDRTKSKDESIVELKHSFASMLMEQNKFDHAESVSREVYEIRKQTPDASSESFKESHRQLCSTLRATGRCKDAEKMQRSIYQSENMDPWALENGDEVCQRLREQGNIKGAKDLQDDVWKERQKKQGPRDGLAVRSGLRVVGDLENLVATVDNRRGTDAERRLNTGNKQSYESQIEIVLSEIWSTRLSRETNLDILNAGHKLGSVLFLQGKFPDAEAIFRPVWEGKRQQLGERNDSTMSTGGLLGKALCRQNKYNEAVRVLLGIWQTLMNRSDAESLSIGEDLAQAYRFLGNLSDAERAYECILRHKERSAGFPAQEIEDSRWNLGQIRYMQGKNHGAEIVLRQLYQQWNASSPNSDRTLQCGHMLAHSIWTEDGKPDRALNIALGVLKGRGASLVRGVAYLESAHLYNSLLLEAKHFPEAETSLKSVWEHKAEGAEEQRLRSKCGYLYGQALCKGQKYQRAKKVLQTVIKDQETNPEVIHEIPATRELLERVDRSLKEKERKASRWRNIRR